MSTKDGGPAFPAVMNDGKTLRDYFAAHAPENGIGIFSDKEEAK